MIWTLLAFVVTLFVLRKFAFPRIAEALDKRQRAIEESIDAAERTRTRGRRAARRVPRAPARRRARRPTRSSPGPQAPARRERRVARRGQAQREELLEQTRRDIEAETRRAIQEIRHEVADLTVLATEKVTRKTLTAGRPASASSRRRWASSTSPRSGERERRLAMEEIAQVYSRSLFEVAKEHGKLDDVREQLGQFADALDENRDLAVFFFSPYFSTEEKKEGLGRARRRRRS